MKEIPKFGHEMKKKHFLLDDITTFIQHGSYGATLKQAMKYFRNWQDLMEKQPCAFMNSIMLKYMVVAIRHMAAFVSANTDDVVFVQNASAGFNTIIRSLDFKHGDTILVTSLGYDAVSNTINYICSRTGASMIVAQIPFPLQRDQIIQKIKDAILPSTKLVVVDHITSGTAIVMPIEEIIKECHSRNIPIFIDGAHAVGQVPLDLNKWNPDFYVSNCHKWLCAPKGIAFLRVAKQHQPKIHPLVVSHGYQKGFQAEFLWVATMDYCSYLSMMSVIAFYNRVGPQKIMDYNHNLVAWAGKMLADAWGTEMLVADESMFGSMAEVRLPITKTLNSLEIKEIHDTLVDKYHIQTVLIAIEGKVYTRLSAQMYNEESDYKKFADAIKEMFLSTK